MLYNMRVSVSPKHEVLFFSLLAVILIGKKKFLSDLHLAAVQELNIAICYSNIPPESFSKNTNYLSYAYRCISFLSLIPGTQHTLSSSLSLQQCKQFPSIAASPAWRISLAAVYNLNNHLWFCFALLLPGKQNAHRRRPLLPQQPHEDFPVSGKTRSRHNFKANSSVCSLNAH